jgi:hypothetical protein
MFILNSKNQARLFILGFALIINSACKTKADNSLSDEQSIMNATVFELREDGNYRVSCDNGPDQVYSFEQIREGMNNPTQQIICPSPYGDIGGTALTSRLFRRDNRPAIKNLRCLARDNDNRAPWIIARVEAGVVTKLGSFTYNTVDNCNHIAGLYSRGISFTCYARDSDDRAPFTLFELTQNGPIKVQAGIGKPSKNSCFDFYSSFKNFNGKWLTCGDRDNDGRAPFLIQQINDINFQVYQFQENKAAYTTLSECRSILGEGTDGQPTRPNCQVSQFILPRGSENWTCGMNLPKACPPNMGYNENTGKCVNLPD